MRKTHTVVTTDAQIDAALEHAKRFEANDRRAIKAEYLDGEDALRLVLQNGVKVSIPRRYLQGLEHARPAEMAKIELLGHGTGVRWPALDVDHYVPGLLSNVFGTRQWMAHVGRLGGAARSAAKKAAARANGRKGGRPAKAATNR
jgi:hypothetical protein